MARVLIALGGNIGDVGATFDEAIPALLDAAQANLIAASSYYSTPPWGDADQARFLNACIDIETVLDPQTLLATMQRVEMRFGRDRTRESRWGPRTLDLDMIAYDELHIDMPALTLPHPRLFERAFVLVPLAEIAADRIIGGRRIGDALSAVSIQGITRLPR